ncbi:MAG: hypothetical protein J7K88_03430 [Candidatus Fermentibacteraceae bacterium]|nr:hypothetical protein [Candidatus Fermentibacteraceae bacterium]
MGTQVYRIAVAAILLTLFSCAYSFRGSLPENVKSVQVEQFRSTVTEYGLEQDITALVTESIVRDGRLSIDNDNPDVHITGSVSYFSRTAVTYTAGEEVEQYKLEIRVVVSMGNAVGNEYIIRDETVSEWLLYDPSSENLESARDRLVAQVSDAVVRRCLSGW